MLTEVTTNSGSLQQTVSLCTEMMSAYPKLRQKSLENVEVHFKGWFLVAVVVVLFGWEGNREELLGLGFLLFSSFFFFFFFWCRWVIIFWGRGCFVDWVLSVHENRAGTYRVSWLTAETKLYCAKSSHPHTLLLKSNWTIKNKKQKFNKAVWNNCLNSWCF